MVSRDSLINAIKSKGFAFKRQTERIDLYKQKGSTKRVEIRKRDYFDRKSVTHILRTAGFSMEEVRAFLGECDHTRH
jgi:hypothetical protein